jgi:hypothetical protein
MSSQLRLLSPFLLIELTSVVFRPMLPGPASST